MKKIKGNHQPDSSATTKVHSTPVPLNESVAAAALRLINPQLGTTGQLGDGRAAVDASAEVDGLDLIGIAVLKERCAAFGINATNAELLSAGLHLLAQQTETALEVAMLQSLRADRSFAKRRSRRT